MQRSPKRRRSNEGHAVPVCEVPKSMVTSVKQEQKPSEVSSSPLTELASSQLHAPSQLQVPPKPKMDYQTTLMSLSDEYMNAAYSMITGFATGNASEEQEEEYYSLVSTAMGCLESCLKHYRQPDPRREAQIRLRLANLLIEETENDQEAEEVLSKGIVLCDRSRLVDLRYTMHHLSVRLSFKRSPKAALKSVDKLVQEVETLRQWHWAVAFRFLRVSLSLQLGSHTEHAAALKHMNALKALAEDQRLVAIQILAATLESIVHLRTGNADALNLTQRAMASARTHQLGEEMQQMPQIRALLDCLDLTCSLIQFNDDQAGAKLQQMQNNLDQGTRDAGWRKDGDVFVPLGFCENEKLEQDTAGIMRRSQEGEAMLVMRWITSSQLYALGFLLSGLTKSYQNSSDVKAGQFLAEGLKMTKLAPDGGKQSLAAASASVQQHRALDITLHLYMIFACCGRNDWTEARAEIKALRKSFADAGSAVDQSTHRTLLYLEAMCKQGLGELKAALELYRSPLLTFQPESKASNLEKDLRALATLNGVFISRTLDVGDPINAEKTLADVESYCINHKSKDFLSVYYLAKATAQGPNNAIIKTKQYIQTAVQAAKEASNNQLLCIVMNLMTDTFFKNTIVGEQAEKAASAGRSLAKKTRNSLWTTVADDMFADIMERCGKPREAEAARREAQALVLELPEALRKSAG